VQRFADAFEHGEVGAIRAMLAEEATSGNCWSAEIPC
jgi:hypothetical protein